LGFRAETSGPSEYRDKVRQIDQKCRGRVAVTIAITRQKKWSSLMTEEVQKDK